EEGFCDTPGNAWSVAVSGNYAYVADSHDGLRVINITNPASPFEEGFYDTPGSAQGVAVSGNYAYVANEYVGLRIINITNPASPYEEGYYVSQGIAKGVAVSGNHAYVAAGSRGLRVVNVTNPAAPYGEGFYNMPGYAYGVAISGSYAFVVDGEHGLRVLDIANPASPVEVGFYEKPGRAMGVAVVGSIAYVADYISLGIYDCSEAVSAAEHTQPYIPDRIALEPCYPNPFNPSTTIRYNVAVPSRVQLTVYNLLGQEVARLVDGRQLAGFHSITWNAGSLPSGLYLCRMEAAEFMQTRKLVLMK
ncbi:T9SS type A sorting domain-containing protein, partial [bacterium]|nr:T9SS type A sorting domain-containing protein [bacterium]